MPAKIAVVTGPTATGKTRLGVLLCQKFNGEVVSADSMQIYRGMDIGTAKPTEEEMCGVPHHMIDIADPGDSYSVSRYVEDATHCVDDILSRGKLPVVVGGTGLYIESLIAGRSFAALPGEAGLRLRLSSMYDEKGGEEMLAELSPLDPESASKLHPNDKKRIIRAYEVFYTTGRPISSHNHETAGLTPRYLACKISLNYSSRADLYSRIDARVDEMLSSGLYEEVLRLISTGVDKGSTALQAIGYKEFFADEHINLSGEALLKAAGEMIKTESRRYAKRQLSWFRRDKSINWITWNLSPDFDTALRLSTCFLENFGII